MKRYPLLIQLIVYIFLLVLVLLGLVGSLYYQTSSGTIRQLTERTTRNSMEQSGQFIASYLQKLKQTTSTLSKEEAIRKFAQNQESSETPVQTLMKTIIETDPDLVSAVLVTKDGRVVSTDSQISMQTSSDICLHFAGRRISHFTEDFSKTLPSFWQSKKSPVLSLSLIHI